MGKTLRELRASLLPGEMALYRAIARHDGPFWGEREDVLSALLMSTIAATHGAEVEPRQFLPNWQPVQPLILLPWDHAAQILTAMAGQ